MVMTVGDLFCPGLFILIVIIAIIIANQDNNGSSNKARSRKGKRRNYQSNRTIYIYKLMDGNKAFYVGQTVNPDRRLVQHINDYTWSLKSEYIMNMRNDPRMVIITQTNSRNRANQLENKYMRMWGETNMRWA